MNAKLPAIRRCTECKDKFQPVRIGLVVTKQCGNSACELGHAVSVAAKPKKPRPKKKEKTAARLKKDLWPIFSLHQKLVHSEDGKYCQCYTCEKPIEIGTANCQGGHCLSKAVYKNLYFDERAVRPQCYYCNINLGGMHYDFCEKLKLEIGVEEFNTMKKSGKDIVKRDKIWYLEAIAYYADQNKILKQLKSI